MTMAAALPPCQSHSMSKNGEGPKSVAVTTSFDPSERWVGSPNYQPCEFLVWERCHRNVRRKPTKDSRSCASPSKIYPFVIRLLLRPHHHQGVADHAPLHPFGRDLRPPPPSKVVPYSDDGHWPERPRVIVVGQWPHVDVAALRVGVGEDRRSPGWGVLRCCGTGEEDGKDDDDGSHLLSFVSVCCQVVAYIG